MIWSLLDTGEKASVAHRRTPNKEPFCSAPHQTLILSFFHWIRKVNISICETLNLASNFSKILSRMSDVVQRIQYAPSGSFLEINVDPTVHHPVCATVVIKGSGLFSVPGNTHTLIRYCLTSIRPCGFRQRPLFLFSNLRQMLLRNAVHPQHFEFKNLFI